MSAAGRSPVASPARSSSPMIMPERNSRLDSAGRSPTSTDARAENSSDPRPLGDRCAREHPARERPGIGRRLFSVRGARRPRMECFRSTANSSPVMYVVNSRTLPPESRTHLRACREAAPGCRRDPAARRARRRSGSPRLASRPGRSRAGRYRARSDRSRARHRHERPRDLLGSAGRSTYGASIQPCALPIIPDAIAGRGPIRPRPVGVIRSNAPRKSRSGTWRIPHGSARRSSMTPLGTEQVCAQRRS